MTTEHSEQELPAADIAQAGHHAFTRISFAAALGGGVLYLAFYTGMVLFNLHAPQLPPALWLVLGPATTVGYLIIMAYTIRLLAGTGGSGGQNAALMGVSLLCFMGLNPAVRSSIVLLLQHQSWETVLAAITAQSLPPVFGVLVPFFLILTGVFFGKILAGLIRERAMLVPVGLVAGLVDFWGVYWGPVNMMSTANPAAVNALATASTAAATVPDAVKTQLPEQLRVFGNLAPPQSIGLGDFVFLAFFLACAYRLGFSVKRTMWGIVAGLLVASVISALDGQTLCGHLVKIEYLPGLVFICGGVLLANLFSWQLSRNEWAMTGVLVAIFAAGIISSIVRVESHKPHEATGHYAITAHAPREVIAAMQSHVLQMRTAPADVVTVGAVFLYAVKNHAPVLKKWQVLLLGRGAQPDVATTREIIATGSPDEKAPPAWSVNERSVSPPERLLGILMSKDAQDPLTLIREAKDLAPEKLAVLDRVPAYARTLPEGAKFVLQLLPHVTRVLDNDGKLAKAPLLTGK